VLVVITELVVTILKKRSSPDVAILKNFLKKKYIKIDRSDLNPASRGRLEG